MKIISSFELKSSNLAWGYISVGNLNLELVIIKFFQGENSFFRILMASAAHNAWQTVENLREEAAKIIYQKFDNFAQNQKPFASAKHDPCFASGSNDTQVSWLRTQNRWV